MTLQGIIGEAGVLVGDGGMDVEALLGEMQFGFSPRLLGEGLKALDVGALHRHREEDPAGIKVGGEGAGVDPALDLLGTEDQSSDVRSVVLGEEVMDATA